MTKNLNLKKENTEERGEGGGKCIFWKFAENPNFFGEGVQLGEG